MHNDTIKGIEVHNMIEYYTVAYQEVGPQYTFLHVQFVDVFYYKQTFYLKNKS